MRSTSEYSQSCPKRTSKSLACRSARAGLSSSLVALREPRGIIVAVGPSTQGHPGALAQEFPQHTGEIGRAAPVTIMFCDLVGSSALSTQLDPEDQRELVGAFQSCCAEEIKRLGGLVAQYLGDGVLAYFGHPIAHEDDAERAVRVGLAIPPAVGALELIGQPKLQTRIGIATGIVVVGDLVGVGITQENAAIGQTDQSCCATSVAGRAGDSVICPKTYQLVGRLFEYHDLGEHSLKGFAKAVRVASYPS